MPTSDCTGSAAMATDTLPVLVLGTGVTALGVARILAHDGIPAWHVTERPDHLRHSRHYRPYRTYRPHRFSEDLAEWLTGFPEEAAVLMPCADSLVREVAALSPALRERFRAVVPDEAVVTTVTDKAGFARFLAGAGIPHPVTVVTGPDTSVPDLAGAFLKPTDSQAFFARHGIKGLRADSPAALRALLADLAAQGDSMVVQEYVPGPAGSHVFVDGYAGRDGRIRALFPRRRLRMYPPDFGNSSFMVSVTDEEARLGGRDDPLLTVRRLIAALGLVGIFSVELKRDDRDGIFKVLEVNARPWWYVEFAARAGVDVCRLAYRDALGLPVDTIDGHVAGRAMTYPPYDYPAWRHARARGGPSFLRWMSEVVHAEQPVWRMSDPLPGLMEYSAMAARRLNRLLGGG